MGIVQAFLTIGGVLAIIGLLAVLFCHYLGGWTWTKAWLRSSGEEKMVLTRAGTHRHFNPNGYMVSSESDLNLSGRGSFRRFDTTDHDYQIFRQGSTTSLLRQQGPNSSVSSANFIPPQPLRPAPIPPLIGGSGAGELTSQSSFDSVFNTAPSSPAQLAFGTGSSTSVSSSTTAVPKIPPPPQQRSGSTSSISSHASLRSAVANMGDGNNDRGGGGTGTGAGETGDMTSTTTTFSSTNPFLPLLQASSEFITQTVHTFHSGQQQQSQNVSASTTSRTVDASSTEGRSYRDEVSLSRSSVGSTSSIPPGSAGLSMGELLFSAPPVYQPTNLPLAVTTQRTNADTMISMSTSEASPLGYSPTGTKHSRPVAPVVGVRSVSTGSPQHARNLYHQSSAENLAAPLGNTTGGSTVIPTAHSPTPPSSSPGNRRASYPNRKEYTPHDTIPKSEFPQHIQYIPSLHYHHHLHHNKTGSGVPGSVPERKIGVICEVGTASVVGGPFSDPLRHHHHYLPSSGAAGNVQPFLEEQEEPPEEPCTNHQLSKSSFPSNLDMEREDLTNRIMLETMREEIRIANEKMADATKSLMMDDVFLPTTSGNNSTNNNYSSTKNNQQNDSPRRRTFSIAGESLSLSLSSPGKKSEDSIDGHTTTASLSASTGKGVGLRRSSTPNSRAGMFSSSSGFSSGVCRPTTLIQRQRSNEDLPRRGPPPICVNNREVSNATETGKFNGSQSGNRELFGNAGRAYSDGSFEATTTRNGLGNGGAVSSSEIRSSNIVSFSSRIPSGSQPPSQPSTGTEVQPSQKQGTVSADQNNGTGTTNVNNLPLSNVTGSNANAPSSRPPTVGSYFKQNSRSFSLRQSSTDSIGSDISDLSSPTDGSLPSLQRAMSCDSVCSDTSVILGDLDPPHMTGHLCIGLEYDSETADLLVNVMEAKELVGPDPDPNAPFDSYVRVYLLPDKTTNMQTRVYRKSLCPVYKEKFMFGLEMNELASRSLVFYLYATDKYTNTLIGEAELKLGDIDFSGSVVTWLLLTDTGQRGGEFGEIMFSLSYLPTAERLTVVVVKARNLKFPHERETGDPFVKVYLLQKGKKVSKKKSSTKRGERNPIFNEAMIFSIPAHALQTIQLRITVADSLEAEGRAYSIGHVIVGSVATGKALSHWNQMLSSLRKPIAMWHALRK